MLTFAMMAVIRGNRSISEMRHINTLAKPRGCGRSFNDRNLSPHPDVAGLRHRETAEIRSSFTKFIYPMPHQTQGFFLGDFFMLPVIIMLQLVGLRHV